LRKIPVISGGTEMGDLEPVIEFELCTLYRWSVFVDQVVDKLVDSRPNVRDSSLSDQHVINRFGVYDSESWSALFLVLITGWKM
jgi:hypothetical protein